MTPFFELLDVVIDLYMLIVFIYVVLSWLIAFEIVNPRQELIRAVRETSAKLTEPALSRIRKHTSKLNLGAFDISPVILLLLLYFVKRAIYHYIFS